MAEQREQALSETLAVVLIAMLVIIATVLLIASLTGAMNKMLQTPAFIVVKADNVSTVGGKVIRLYHLQGDAVILNGTSQSDGVSIKSVKRGFSGRWKYVLQNKKDSMAIWRYNLHLL